ncbi:MAG: PilZ domain-containing protein [Syntrophales bacterium]
MTPDRRKRTRIPLNLDVAIDTPLGRARVETFNISLSGMLCEPGDAFKKGEPCRITIRLNPRIRIAIEGKVLRCGRKDTAIAFSSMDEKSFFHLKKILQYNAGDADGINAELVNPAFK